MQFCSVSVQKFGCLSDCQGLRSYVSGYGLSKSSAISLILRSIVRGLNVRKARLERRAKGFSHSGAPERWVETRRSLPFQMPTHGIPSLSALGAPQDTQLLGEVPGCLSGWPHVDAALPSLDPGDQSSVFSLHVKPC